MVLSKHSRGQAKTIHTADHVAKQEAKKLPTATVQKIINEVLASQASKHEDGGAPAQSMTFAKETRDLLIECCVEFITMLSTEANEIAEKDAKKTIACEHVNRALEDLGFGEYVPELQNVANNFKTSQVVCFTRRWDYGAGRADRVV